MSHASSSHPDSLTQIPTINLAETIQKTNKPQQNIYKNVNHFVIVMNFKRQGKLQCYRQRLRIAPRKVRRERISAQYRSALFAKESHRKKCQIQQ